MSDNVFGNPVTDTTVKLLYPTLREITARHRAEVAIEHMNINGKVQQVTEFVHTLIRSYRPSTATLCMIYNATGDNLTLFERRPWGGDVIKQFWPYLIQNGQWIGLLHTNRSGNKIGVGGSCEGVVYKGQKKDGIDPYWVQSFQTTPRTSQNHVYTQVGSWNRNWSNIYSEMGKQRNNHSSTANGYSSNVTIGNGASPEFVGIMTLSGLTTKYIAMASDVSTIFPSLDSKYDYDDDDDDDGAEGDDATPLPDASLAAE